jgi:hypothetical protein
MLLGFRSLSRLRSIFLPRYFLTTQLLDELSIEVLTSPMNDVEARTAQQVAMSVLAELATAPQFSSSGTLLSLVCCIVYNHI